MKSTTMLPAIRARVGDWTFYVTTLTFSEIASLIQTPDELHDRKRLSDWIQREAIDKHAGEIATYIEQTPQRFLGALIIGVYGGSPDWTPIGVNGFEEDVSEDQLKRIGERLGVLHFTGGEKLFAIDGQHRVAGIKAAVIASGADDNMRGDSVSAIFVGHDPSTVAGKVRTRRLFTTVNKKAKIVSKAARIALDEDDGFAIVTRRLIDTHKLFADGEKTVAYGSGNGQIPATDQDAITSVVGLYELAKDLYGSPLPKGFDKERPADGEIDNYVEFLSGFFNSLLKHVPEYKTVFVDRTARAGDFRTGKKNHMLFRPAGQRAFCKALQLMLARGMPKQAALKKLLEQNLYLQSPVWHHILWDPVGQVMITTKVALAETQLLRLAHQSARTKAHSANLAKLLASIDA